MEMNVLAIAGFIGIAVCLLAFGISSIVSAATDPVRRRVAATASSTESRTPGVSVDFGSVVDRFSKYVLPTKADEQSTTQLRLIQAGFRSHAALKQFYGLKAVLAIALPVVVYLGVRWIPSLTTSYVLIFVIFAGFVGVRLPDTVLGHIRKKRIKRLRNGFPDSLDLLVVCVESGLGLIPAVERVARELEISNPELAQEYSLVTAEIRAGVERPAALKNLARRSGVDDINGLVALLIQTIRFGTSIADALRVYSEEFRDKRMQKAEEQAAKIGTKMIFPMVLCFFPSFFIVAIGPAVIRIFEAFKTV